MCCILKRILLIPDNHRSLRHKINRRIISKYLDRYPRKACSVYYKAMRTVMEDARPTSQIFQIHQTYTHLYMKKP